MELAGEVVGGHFFSGVNGIQFASPAALRIIQESSRDEEVYWLNAADPASLCGVDLPALKGWLPERYPSSSLVFRGAKLVVVSRKHGSELEVFVEPTDADLPGYFDCLRSSLTRSYNPRNSIKVKTVNGEPSGSCRYAPVMEEYGFIRDYQGLSLWRM
jgi:ATP-dependent Lhr-like helicase